MIESLKALIPDFSHFQEASFTSGTDIVGHQVTMILKDDTPFSGGTSSDLNTARRICAAEALERAYYLKIHHNSVKGFDSVLTEKYPTTCGFAAGFERQTTAYRAVCEAIERWCWSKWIDDGLKMDRGQTASSSNLTKYFARYFDEVIYLHKAVTLQEGPLTLPFIPREFRFSVAIGIKNGGIFPGSRVTTVEDENWEHAVLEAWRHLQIFENELRSDRKMDIYDRRILNFGLNGMSHLPQILNSESNCHWPKARLLLNRELETDGKYFVWRALCDDYVGWDVGDEFRFVY